LGFSALRSQRRKQGRRETGEEKERQTPVTTGDRWLMGLVLTSLAGWSAQLFALALRHVPGREPRGATLHSAQLAATLLYKGIGLSPLVPFFTLPDASVVDGTGMCGSPVTYRASARCSASAPWG
jgi:hypothetical protein